MLDKVREAIFRYEMVRRGERVLVGVSGGPDSTALLHCLLRLAPELGVELAVAHLNHQLRGEEAAADARYVASLAKTFGMPFFEGTEDVRSLARVSGLGLQEAGRRARYAFLRKIATRWAVSRIALGHHKDDLVETVIFHFLRGTGLEGLAGIPPVRPLEQELEEPRDEDGDDGNSLSVKVIRPLINVSRDEIEAYCREEGLEPRADHSNLSRHYTRNRIRLDLIPLLEKDFNPNLKANLSRLAEIAREEARFLEGEARRRLDSLLRLKHQRQGELSISVTDLLAVDVALRRRMVRRALTMISGGSGGIDFVHVGDILDLVSQGRTGAEIHLPGGIRACLRYGRLILRKGVAVSPPSFHYSLGIPGEVDVPEVGLRFRTFVREAEPGERPWKNQAPDEVLYRAFFDYYKVDKVGGILQVRNRRTGDRFRPLGMEGTKKLKDFFMETQVPRENRDRIPLLIAGGEIMWVTGLRESEIFKVDPSTEKLLLVEAVSVPDLDSVAPS